MTHQLGPFINLVHRYHVSYSNDQLILTEPDNSYLWASQNVKLIPHPARIPIYG